MVAGYMKMAVAALLVVAATALLYLAERKTPYGKLKPWLKQAVAGLLFGALAVIATEYGISVNGATLNVRDAAPLCAGLIFGAPAGLIAGVVGGVERWFAVYWGAGAYTRLACSISTVLAGVFAGALRKHMFDDKKPSWFYGLMIGLVMEVLHMLMIFLTNMNDVHRAFTFIELCAGPMILFNGLAVMCAALVVALLGRERVTLRKDVRKIAQTFQRWLLLCVTIAFLATCLFTVILQTRLSENDAKRLMQLNIADVQEDIKDASDKNLLSITRAVASRLDAAAGGVSRYDLLMQLAGEYHIKEINVIDESGVIIDSTNSDFLGYNMENGEQSAAFMALLGGRSELVQDYQPIAYDQTISRKYAGVALESAGFVQVAYDAGQLQQDISETVVGLTRNRHIGSDGSIIISDERGTIVSDRNGYEGKTLAAAGIALNTAAIQPGECFASAVYGEESLCIYAVSEGYTITASIPKSEAMLTRDVSAYVMAFMEIILFAALFMMIYFLIKRIVVNNIHQINRSLSQITNGNLDVTVDVRANEEFASLSDDINATVVTLKRYIAEAAARIDKELEFARAIQHSALPSVFPPYPNRAEFELYAMMDTAKEVGGDFYDFYLIDEDHLAFVIADVSGKGIPAAMFMMTAKTLINGLAEAGADAAQILTQANEKLCEGNDAGMFVTAWLGLMDIRTGLVTYANAGHNPPLVRHAGEPFTYLRTRPGLVLGGMEGSRYRTGELQLAPGDTLYLYTDGVTEATDAKNALYGEARLKAILDAHADADARRLTELVQRDVEAFVGDAPQFDDITMLALRYYGKQAPLDVLRVPPLLENVEAATRFVEDTLQKRGCPAELLAKIGIVTDELFSNIARYSGATEAAVACGVQNGFVIVRFSDNGKPYDPTAKAEPDTKLPTEARGVGGLGVHLVRSLMDSFVYAFLDGRNILTVQKRLPPA